VAGLSGIVTTKVTLSGGGSDTGTTLESVKKKFLWSFGFIVRMQIVRCDGEVEELCISFWILLKEKFISFVSLVKEQF